MKPLDHRAEAHVRTAVLRAFGITAISPTALTDAVFFLACGVRMVRGIAASYGHRPTAATTIHLLRRLVLEAGKLGAVDIASASLVQHLGGAVTERLATSAADAPCAARSRSRKTKFPASPRWSATYCGAVRTRWFRRINPR